MPVLIRALGTEAFGVWVTVNVVINYFSILDFGFTRGSVKFLADHWAQGETEDFQRVVESTVALFLGLATVGAAASCIGGLLLARFVLDLPPALASGAQVAFVLAAVSFFFNMASVPLAAVPMALQRFEYLTVRVIVVSSVTTLGTVALAWAGFGLNSILAFTAVMNLLATLAYGVAIQRLLGEIRLRPRLHPALLRRIAQFSGFKFLSDISGQIVFQTDRILVGAFLPIAAVTYYAVPALILQRLYPFVGHLVTAAFPAISGTIARGEKERAAGIYLRTSRMAVCVFLPICAFVAIEAFPILDLWAGADIAARSTRTLRVLCLGAFVAALAGIPSMANEARGRPQVTAAFAVLSAVLNVAFNLILIPLYGFEGSAWALLLNGACQVPLFVLLTNRQMGVPLRGWLRQTLIQPFCILAAPALALVALTTRLTGIELLFGGAAVFGPAYAALAYFFLASADERQWLGQRASQAAHSIPGRSRGQPGGMRPTEVKAWRFPD